MRRASTTNLARLRPGSRSRRATSWPRSSDLSSTSEILRIVHAQSLAKSTYDVRPCSAARLGSELAAPQGRSETCSQFIVRRFSGHAGLRLAQLILEKSYCSLALSAARDIAGGYLTLCDPQRVRCNKSSKPHAGIDDGCDLTLEKEFDGCQEFIETGRILHGVYATREQRLILGLSGRPTGTVSACEGEYASDMSNEWIKPEHVEEYLRLADTIPHRAEGEAVVLELLPHEIERVLDLGTGDGRLLSIVLTACKVRGAVGLDMSPKMLELARARFAGTKVKIIEHDFAAPLPGLEEFDVVVSSFAIHHVDDGRKHALYAEVFERLRPGGTFCNLEHVASPTEDLHREFLALLDTSPEEEDPSNQLLDVETQLGWLRDIGFEDVDCYWKWRELALLAGRRPR